jgi:hypothetical protein
MRKRRFDVEKTATNGLVALKRDWNSRDVFDVEPLAKLEKQKESGPKNPVFE